MVFESSSGSGMLSRERKFFLLLVWIVFVALVSLIYPESESDKRQVINVLEDNTYITERIVEENISVSNIEYVISVGRTVEDAVAQIKEQIASRDGTDVEIVPVYRDGSTTKSLENVVYFHARYKKATVYDYEYAGADYGFIKDHLLQLLLLFLAVLLTVLILFTRWNKKVYLVLIPILIFVFAFFEFYLYINLYSFNFIF